jgi:predicted phage-related endonuclease
VRANADRLITPCAKGLIPFTPGVLEIKVPAAWSFRKIKKEGLPEAYILQIQWQMLCYGTGWGSFCVYWPDGHELLWFDIERDHELCSMLLERAKEEWAHLELLKKQVGAQAVALPSMPLLKDSTYTGCTRCAAFERCHGFVIPEGVSITNDSLEGAAERYETLATEIKGLESEREALKEIFRSQFAEFPADRLMAGRFQIGIREQTRESLSPDVKKELTPEQLVKYTKQTKYEVLTVKRSKV